MFKQRVTTAILLIILFLWVIFLGPRWSLFLFLGAIVSLCGWEWSRLCGLRTTLHRLSYALMATALSTLAFFAMKTPSMALIVATAGLLLWSIISAYLLAVKSIQPLGDRISIVSLLIAPVIFFIALWSLIWLRHSERGSAELFILFFCVVWLADTGAYCTGKLLGRRKLMPHISPGKTIEGAVGGGVFVLLFVPLFIFFSQLAFTWLSLLMAALSATVLSIVGDLFESAKKRAAGIKDSGALLPGHGGVLDRLDGVFAAAPVFVFVLLAI